MTIHSTEAMSKSCRSFFSNSTYTCEASEYKLSNFPWSLQSCEGEELSWGEGGREKRTEREREGADLGGGANVEQRLINSNVHISGKEIFLSDLLSIKAE